MWSFSMLINQSVNTQYTILSIRDSIITQYDFLDIAVSDDFKSAKVDEWAGHFLG